MMRARSMGLAFLDLIRRASLGTLTSFAAPVKPGVALYFRQTLMVGANVTMFTVERSPPLRTHGLGFLSVRGAWPGAVLVNAGTRTLRVRLLATRADTCTAERRDILAARLLRDMPEAGGLACGAEGGLLGIGVEYAIDFDKMGSDSCAVESRVGFDIRLRTRARLSRIEMIETHG
mgnify:FL=1